MVLVSVYEVSAHDRLDRFDESAGASLSKSKPVSGCAGHLPASGGQTHRGYGEEGSSEVGNGLLPRGKGAARTPRTGGWTHIDQYRLQEYYTRPSAYHLPMTCIFRIFRGVVNHACRCHRELCPFVGTHKPILALDTGVFVPRVHRKNPALSGNPIPAFGVKRKAGTPAQGGPCCLIIDQPQTCEVNSREKPKTGNQAVR